MTYIQSQNKKNKLIKIIEKNDFNQFKTLLYQNKSHIKHGLLEFILFYIIKDLKDSNINTSIPKYISILLSFGLVPNIIIDDSSLKYYFKNNENLNPNNIKGKSLLIFAWEKSCYSLLKNLYEINKVNQLKAEKIVYFI